jgi:aminopeptidase N
MAHMWFGNLITNVWWDEKWINEAFASYFTYVGIEKSQNDLLEWDESLKVGTWDLGQMMIYEDLRRAITADETTRILS